MAALDHATFSPPEVKRAVRRSIQDLAPGGGFVFGAVHITQDDVPPENLMALWEGFLEVRGY
jgi:uroporphyrinogen decarboxylase